MNILQLHPIVEMQRFCAGCLRAARGNRDVDPELKFEGAKEIAQEIATERVAHDSETLRLIATAQQPESPGGRNIRPAEAAPIQERLTDSISTVREDGAA